MKTTLPNGEGIKWPNGAKVAVMLSFDFDADRLQVARAWPGSPGFADRSRGMYGPDEGLARCLRVLKETEVPSTFFIPGINIDRFPEHVNRIVESGAEIAYHGFYHDNNFDTILYDRAEEEMEMAEERIESIWGRKPVGARLPGGYMQRYTVDLLHKRGYKYSSALSPEKSCDWAFCYEREGRKIPLVEMCTDVCTEDFTYYFFSLATPRHNPTYNNDYVREIWQDEFDGRVKEEDKFLCLKLHPSIIGRASRAKMLQDFILYMKENGAWFATCEEVADYVLKDNGFTV